MIYDHRAMAELKSESVLSSEYSSAKNHLEPVRTIPMLVIRWVTQETVCFKRRARNTIMISLSKNTGTQHSLQDLENTLQLT